MSSLAIPVTIAPAKSGDCFFQESGISKVREHRLYFFQKLDGSFRGPFYLHDGYDVVELSIQQHAGYIYMLVEDNATDFTFLINLEPAHADDLKDGKRLRYGYCYWLRPDNDHVEGPFFLSPDTDVQLLARQLRSGHLLKAAAQQNFNPYKFQHSA